MIFTLYMAFLSDRLIHFCYIISLIIELLIIIYKSIKISDTTIKKFSKLMLNITPDLKENIILLWTLILFFSYMLLVESSINMNLNNMIIYPKDTPL